MELGMIRYLRCKCKDFVPRCALSLRNHLHGADVRGPACPVAAAFRKGSFVCAAGSTVMRAPSPAAPPRGTLPRWAGEGPIAKRW